MSETECNVADGQLLVQSFYEERDRAIRRGTAHHSLRTEHAPEAKRGLPEPSGASSPGAVELGTVMRQPLPL